MGFRDKIKCILSGRVWVLLPGLIDCRHYKPAYKFKHLITGREKIVFSCGKCGEK